MRLMNFLRPIFLCTVVVLVAGNCLTGNRAVGAESASAPQTQPAVSFTNDVVPILTKAGCNGGVCHAKAGNGQNGFQLSLFGFEPGEDFEHIVNEARGRRISQTAPERSLLLLKATGMLPHGGGARLKETTDAYRTVRDWIRQGARSDVGSASELTSLKVDPERASLSRHERRQLRVTAVYADGRTRDVTQQAVYESNDRALAESTNMVSPRSPTLPATSRSWPDINRRSPC